LLDEWHNIAEGRIFMLGSGPSLINQLPLLALLERETTFACNSLPAWKELPFTPTYYGVTDIESQEVLDGLTWPEMKMHKFHVGWRDPIGRGADVLDDEHPTNLDFIWVEKAKENVQMWNHGFVGLGDELTPLPTGRTSPFTLTQLAAWMGYREFYFLGIEQTRGYCYDPDATMGFTNRHSFPLDKSPKYQMAVQRSAERMRVDIEMAGGKVYDCSPGGLLNETNNIQRGIKTPVILEYRNLGEVLRVDAVVQ
jgi:hypothetical protein